MAPVKARDRHRKSQNRRSLQSSRDSTLHRVQSGRLGRVSSSSRDNSQPKGNMTHFNADRYSQGRTSAKELFPTLVDQTKQHRVPLSITRQHNAGKELLPNLLKHSNKENAGKPVFRRSHTSSGKAAYLRGVNQRQSRIHRAKDAIAKRMLVLAVEHGSTPQDLRDEQTMPYSALRLDLDPMNGPSKLHVSISCGFWGYAPAFSTTKIFTFSLDKFSTPDHVQKVICNTRNIHEAGKQVGIDIRDSSIVIVAYEVMFPKGYRSNPVDYTDIKNINPITYVPADSRVLVNTACALREFFLQAANHACDVFGNVSIPMIARIGRFAPEPFYGGLSAQQFDRNWRSDEERNCAAEERYLLLEQQQFADADQKLMIRKKMKAIQDKAEKAVQAHQASTTEDRIDADITISTDTPSMTDDTGVPHAHWLQQGS